MKIIPAERARGRTQCESDISEGRLQLFWQIRSSWGQFMASLFEERFEIHVIPVSDITNDKQCSFRGGYNERISEHIDSLFGSGSMDAALAEVDAYRQLRYREYLESRST